MELAEQVLNWKDKQDKQEKRVRYGTSDDDYSAVVCAKDVPTGRTPTFTHQILANSEFEPFLRQESVRGPSKGSRQAQVLTTQGVRALLVFLDRSKPQRQNLKDSERAKLFLENQLLPQMEALDRAAEERRKALAATTVGRPKPVTIGRPSREVGAFITLKIGSTSFSTHFENLEVDTITVGRGKHQRTYTAGQLFEVMEYRF